METEPARFARREDHFTRGYPHPNGRACDPLRGRTRSTRHHRRPARRGRARVLSAHTRLEHAPESNGVAKPWQSGRLVSSDSWPQATARPCSRIRRCVASRTTSSKSCVTRINGMSSVRRRLVDLILQASSHRAIDSRKGFVEQQYRRLTSERPRQRNTLTLTAGELLRTAVQMLGQVHQGEQLFRPRTSLAPRPMPERGDDVACRRQMRKERILLKHEPHGTTMRWSEGSSRGVAPRLGARAYGRLIRTIESGNAAQDGGLAAARRPEDGQHVAGIAGEFQVERNRVPLPEAHRQPPVTHDGRLRVVTASSSSSGSPRRSPAASPP